MDSNILFLIIKLVLGGLVSFFAILLMSKTRDAAWMFLVAGFLLSYISMVYDVLCELGVLYRLNLAIFGIPLIPLLGILLPTICFITGLLIKIIRK